MSKVTKKIIKLPDGVDLKLEGQFLVLTKAEKKLTLHFKSDVCNFKIDEERKVTFSFKETISASVKRKNIALIGSYHSQLYSMIGDIFGAGYVCKLKLSGVGYKASFNSGILYIVVGYSHGFAFMIPKDVAVKVDDKGTEFTLTCYNRKLVSTIAYRIRSVRKPEVYHLTGIFVNDEKITKKDKKK